MATIDTIANEAYQRHLLKGAEVAPVAVEQKVDSLVKRPPVTEVPEPEVETGKNVIMRFIDALTNDVYDSSILERAQKEPSTDVQMGSDKMYGRYKTPLHVFQAMNRDVDPDSAEMYVRETPSLDYLNMLDIDAREEEMELQEYRRMVAGDSEFSFPTEARQVSSKIKIPKFAESEDPEVTIKDAPDADIVLDEPTSIETEGLGSRPVAEEEPMQQATQQPSPASDTTEAPLEPIASLRGVQQRLKDLGYYTKAVDGVAGEKSETTNAIKTFQYLNNFPVTGNAADEQTRLKLAETGLEKVKEPENNLLKFISEGEGGYGAANNGTSTLADKFSVSQSYYSDTYNKPLTEMTVNEIMNAQVGTTGLTKDELLALNPELEQYQRDREFFAVGAYQIIPKTLWSAVRSGDVKGDEVFTPSFQDRVALEFLIGSDRPTVRDYIQGKSNVTVDQAVLSLAKQFASVPVPPNTTKTLNEGTDEERVINIPEGNSYYGSGNQALHTVAQTRQALEQERDNYIQKQATP